METKREQKKGWKLTISWRYQESDRWSLDTNYTRQDDVESIKRGLCPEVKEETTDIEEEEVKLLYWS